MRTCSKCHAEKQLEQFSRSRIAKDGYHTWCKPCKAAASREWFAANRERLLAEDRAEYAADGSRERAQARQWHRDNRNRSLESKRAWKLSNYGLTTEQYDQMLAAQQGKCAICGGTGRGKKRDLAVDHCHQTHMIRGLLCHHCNVGIGHFLDSPELLVAAARYLSLSAAEKTA